MIWFIHLKHIRIRTDSVTFENVRGKPQIDDPYQILTTNEIKLRSHANQGLTFSD